MTGFLSLLFPSWRNSNKLFKGTMQKNQNDRYFCCLWQRFSIKQVLQLHLQILCSVKDTIKMNGKKLIWNVNCFNLTIFISPNSKGLPANKNNFKHKVQSDWQDYLYKLKKDITIGYTMLPIDGTKIPWSNLKVKHLNNLKCWWSKWVFHTFIFHKKIFASFILNHIKS